MRVGYGISEDGNPFYLSECDHLTKGKPKTRKEGVRARMIIKSVNSWKEAAIFPFEAQYGLQSPVEF
jgi:hypothetical protein